jgi:carbamoyl-phosphate synthase large subunit
MSKITGIPMVEIATRLILGSKIKDLGYQPGLARESEYVAVKAPVFSFSKLKYLDTFLSPEMKSTGEVMGVDKDFYKALYKALLASGIKIPYGGTVLLSVADRNKEECYELARKFEAIGFKIAASEDTHSYLKQKGIEARVISNDNIINALKEDDVSMVINTPTRGKITSTQGFLLRRTAMEYSIPCITSIETANALIWVLEHMIDESKIDIYSLDEYSSCE